MKANTKVPHSAELRAVITRADGTVEDLGVISATYDNPVKQIWWELVGKHLAERRIAIANRGAMKHKE